jgi:phage gp36-like protein
LPYSKRASLNLDEKRLAELTDSVSAPGVVDEGVIETEQKSATSIIDGYLFARYSLPLTPSAPPIMAPIELAIWRYRLYARRPEMEPPKEIADEYKWAMDLLKEIASGDFLLAAEEAAVGTASPPKIISNPLRGWTFS